MIITRKGLDREHARSLHVPTPANTPEEKLKRLITWKHWRKQGYKGKLLHKRTKMKPFQVRELAKELNFDLEGLA